MRSLKEKLVLVIMTTACITLFAFTAARTFAGGKPSEKALRPPSTQTPPTKTMSVASLQQLAKEAITSHPSDQIAKDLHGLILAGDVLLNIQKISLGFDAAAFTSDDGLVVLSISPKLLTNGRARSQYTQLVIFHEYQHIKEHRSFMHPLQKLGQTHTSREYFEELLEAEKRAYTAECKFATELNFEHTEGLEFCAAYKSGDTRFMAELYKYLNTLPYYRTQFQLFGIDAL